MSKLKAETVSNIPPLSAEEEDALIHARITNDERPLRRVIKKFHSYVSVAYPTAMGPLPSATNSVEEAREAFLIELSSFALLLRKSRMICDAERRQVEVYEKEKQRIANEHNVLRNEIEQLKSALEQAQLERRRKIEYDQIAEKINVLPSREELEHSIASLENDMSAIRDEHDTQNRTLLARKSALDSIVSELSSLRIFGKDSVIAGVPSGTKSSGTSLRAGSDAPSPAILATSGSRMEVEGEESNEGIGVVHSGNLGESNEGEEKEGSKIGVARSSSTMQLFGSSRQSTPLLHTATSQLRKLNTTGLASAVRDSAIATGNGSVPGGSGGRAMTPGGTNGANMGGVADTPTISRNGTPAPGTPVEGAEGVEEGEGREEGEEGEEGHIVDSLRHSRSHSHSRSRSRSRSRSNSLSHSHLGSISASGEMSLSHDVDRGSIRIRERTESGGDIMDRGELDEGASRREDGEHTEPERSENEEGEEPEDIEMGEVSERERGGRNDEDREEGEASDLSSVLSEPPDE